MRLEILMLICWSVQYNLLIPEKRLFIVVVCHFDVTAGHLHKFQHKFPKYKRVSFLTHHFPETFNVIVTGNPTEKLLGIE